MRFNVIVCVCVYVSAPDAKTKEEEGSGSRLSLWHRKSQPKKKKGTQLHSSFYFCVFRVFIAFTADILRNGWASYQ
jgi:hypothetical protein